MADEKEKLEKELQFLKESYEADVISKEEFERNKERIEKKLSDISQDIEIKRLDEVEKEAEIEKLAKQEAQEEEQGEDKEKEEKIEEKEPAIEEKKEEEVKETTEEKELKYSEEKKSIKTEENKETKDHNEEPKKEKTEIKEAEFEEKKNDVEDITKKETKTEEKPKKKIGMIILWVIIIALLIAGIAYTLNTNKETENSGEARKGADRFTPACQTDSDCESEGKIGLCKNPGEKKAACEFIEDTKTNLIIINDKTCSLCDTSRMISVLSNLFPAMDYAEIDRNSDQGKLLISNLNINMLPAYVFDENITKTYNFEKVSRAYLHKNKHYVMSNDAAGANLYLNRAEVKRKLDVFIDPSQASLDKVKSSISQLKTLFGSKAAIVEHNIVMDGLARELGITVSPTFLINNKVRFSGIQSPDSLKEKFCAMNEMDECKTELSKDVV